MQGLQLAYLMEMTFPSVLCFYKPNHKSRYSIVNYSKILKVYSNPSNRWEITGKIVTEYNCGIRITHMVNYWINGSVAVYEEAADCASIKLKFDLIHSLNDCKYLTYTSNFLLWHALFLRSG